MKLRNYHQLYWASCKNTCNFIYNCTSLRGIGAWSAGNFLNFWFFTFKFLAAFVLLKGAKEGIISNFARFFFFWCTSASNLGSNFPKRIRMSSFNVEALLHFFASQRNGDNNHHLASKARKFLMKISLSTWRPLRSNLKARVNLLQTDGVTFGIRRSLISSYLNGVTVD